MPPQIALRAASTSAAVMTLPDWGQKVMVGVGQLTGSVTTFQFVRPVEVLMFE